MCTSHDGYCAEGMRWQGMRQDREAIERKLGNPDVPVRKWERLIYQYRSLGGRLSQKQLWAKRLDAARHRADRAMERKTLRSLGLGRP